MSAEVNLGWNNTRLQAGARGAEAIVRRTSGEMNNLMNRVQGMDFGKLFGTGVAVVATANLTSHMLNLVGRGYEFNQTMGDSETAIANIIRRFQGLDAVAAKGEAKKAMQAIVELEPQTAASLSGLTQGFLATFASAQAAGISIEQNIDLVGKFANALANANIPADQLVQELRSIFTGNITSDSALAKMLEIRPQDVTAAKEMGRLYDLLNDKVGELGIAGDTAGVAFSTLGSAIDKSMGAFTKGQFDLAVKLSKDLAATLEANQGGFELLGEKAAVATEAVLEMFKGAIAAGGGMAAVLDGGSFGDEFISQWRAMHDAVKATDAAIKDVKSNSSGTGGSSYQPLCAEDKKAQTEAANEMRQIEAQRLALGEKQFDVLMSNLTPMLQSEAILKRIKDLQEQAAGRDGPVHEEERLRILSQIMDLQKQERAIRSEAVEKAAREKKETQDKANDAARIATERANELALLDQELAIINAQNAGHDRKAAALQRAKDIAEETLRIMQATGLAQDEAVKKATALVDGRNKGNENRRADGRKRIRGSDYLETGGREGEKRRLAERDEATRKRLQAIQERSFGGLKEYYDMQKDPNRGKVSTPNLDQYKEMQKRGKNAGAPPPAANGQPAAAQELPTVEQLLKTLITTTEGLKEG